MPISLGLAADDGGFSYFEFKDGWKPELCTPFCREHVLPLLERTPKLTSTIHDEALAFLKSFAEPLDLVSDHIIDRRLLQSLINDLPPNTQFHETLFSLNSRSHLLPADLRRHHALDDAVGLRHLVQSLENDGYTVGFN